MMSSKIYLMILDGFGEGKNYRGNAITKAKMPNLQRLREQYPWTLLKAAGNAVGIPEGTLGGSEVGHYTMGAGRIVFQTFEEINRQIKSGQFFKNTALLKACKYVKSRPKSALHLLGMISDQGVHAHINHLFALLQLAKNNGIEKTFIHAITDGRDVPEKSADKYIKMIQNKIIKLGMESGAKSEAIIATMVGRYYAMDRDDNWNRTKKAYALYTLGKGIVEKNPLSALKKAYTRGEKTDYYIKPIIFDQHGVIKTKDAVIFWNFRTDRARQITKCFTSENKPGFKAKAIVKPFFVCFGDYSKKAKIAFSAPVIKNNLGKIISRYKLNQLRLAETEKYAHVTYFFNSQIETPFARENRIMIDSSKIPSYAQKPEMCARKITKRAIKEMDRNYYSVIIQNFANADLVGHSGDLKATIKACEVLDECIGKIAAKTLAKGYDLIITADHGNAEYMIYKENGEPCPAHTTNPVIFLIVSKKYANRRLRNGRGLQDIAPTILHMLELQKPREMKGQSLFSPL